MGEGRGEEDEGRERRGGWVRGEERRMGEIINYYVLISFILFNKYIYIIILFNKV